MLSPDPYPVNKFLRISNYSSNGYAPRLLQAMRNHGERKKLLKSASEGEVVMKAGNRYNSSFGHDPDTVNS